MKKLQRLLHRSRRFFKVHVYINCMYTELCYTSLDKYMASLFGGWMDIKRDAGPPVVLNVKPILFRKTNSESRP